MIAVAIIQKRRHCERSLEGNACLQGLTGRVNIGAERTIPRARGIPLWSISVIMLVFWMAHKALEHSVRETTRPPEDFHA